MQDRRQSTNDCLNAIFGAHQSFCRAEKCCRQVREFLSPCSIRRVINWFPNDACDLCRIIAAPPCTLQLEKLKCVLGLSAPPASRASPDPSPKLSRPLLIASLDFVGLLVGRASVKSHFLHLPQVCILWVLFQPRRYT